MGQRVSTERGQPTCLVVEADHTMLHLVMNYLREHDIRATSASNSRLLMLTPENSPHAIAKA
jgi:hypothetical protein